MVSIVFAIIAAMLVAEVVLTLRKAKAATPAHRARLHNNVGMLLAFAMVMTGGLIGQLAMGPINIPAIGWILELCLPVLALFLLLIGFAVGLRCVRRIVPVMDRIHREANPWTPSS